MVKMVEFSVGSTTAAGTFDAQQGAQYRADAQANGFNIDGQNKIISRSWPSNIEDPTAQRTDTNAYSGVKISPDGTPYCVQYKAMLPSTGTRTVNWANREMPLSFTTGVKGQFSTQFSAKFDGGDS